jgi:hypothetical protein
MRKAVRDFLAEEKKVFDSYDPLDLLLEVRREGESEVNGIWNQGERKSSPFDLYTYK